MAARKVTITVEGDGPGADTALTRLVDALRFALAPDERPPTPAKNEGAPAR